MTRPPAFVRIALAGAFSALGWATASAAASPDPVVTPPPGFSVKKGPGEGTYSVEYEVSSDTDPDFGCEVGFDPSKAMPGGSQSQINHAAGSSDYAALANASVASAFDVDATAPFSMQGVSGFAMTGVPKGAAGQARALLFVLQTPPGRTVISCVSPPARFDALRPTFERIPRGVALPR